MLAFEVDDYILFITNGRWILCWKLNRDPGREFQ
jgi:hypothetical protein